MKTTFLIVSLMLMLTCGATAFAQDKSPIEREKSDAGISSSKREVTRAKLKGYDRENMNLDVKPDDNFVEYASGNWFKTHPLRDDQMTNGALPQIDEWYDAFDIKKGKLFIPKKKRIRIR